MKLDYSDLDIVCSDRLLKSDEGLEGSVVSQVKSLSSSPDQRVIQVREFYASYLNEKLENVDKKGADIDFSTLALSAGRKNLLNFIQVYDALKADFAYFMKKAKKEVVESEMLAWANRTLDLYLTFGEMHKDQVKLFKKSIQEQKDWFAEQSFKALKVDVNSQSGNSSAETPVLDDFTVEFYKWLDQ